MNLDHYTISKTIQSKNALNKFTPHAVDCIAAAAALRARYSIVEDILEVDWSLLPAGAAIRSSTAHFLDFEYKDLLEITLTVPSSDFINLPLPPKWDSAFKTLYKMSEMEFTRHYRK